jgi:hypothetical protein
LEFGSMWAEAKKAIPSILVGKSTSSGVCRHLRQGEQRVC